MVAAHVKLSLVVSGLNTKKETCDRSNALVSILQNIGIKDLFRAFSENQQGYEDRPETCLITTLYRKCPYRGENIDEGKVTIVVLLALSAEFETIDIPIRIRILQDEFSIHGIPLKWINSYLTNRTVKVLVE
ncbi:hypothetical protein DPMN_006217 [Dreissena polymorpha]|uniref:Uncharacterized protein n=1 Tax=Dreissena polymorpha TaxID=45954 RepID=A0A9D4RXA2_DREPO|nr:hypothetical protein DPMN_006217 [Dreissena polymorpha]